MARKIGILIDNDTLDLKVSVERSGTGQITRGLVIGHSLYQNQALILNCHKGEIKEHPAMGVGISDMIADDDITGWKREITLQMEADSMIVNKIEISSQKLIIDADYSSK